MLIEAGMVAERMGLQAAPLGLGRAVQVEPMKSVLKPAGSTVLKQRYDGPHSIIAFNFNLRRYS
jgi:hypothetical protein